MRRRRSSRCRYGDSHALALAAGLAVGVIAVVAVAVPSLVCVVDAQSIPDAVGAGFAVVRTVGVGAAVGAAVRAVVVVVPVMLSLSLLPYPQASVFLAGELIMIALAR